MNILTEGIHRVGAHCNVPLHLSLTCLRATHRQAQRLRKISVMGREGKVLCVL